MENNVMVEKKCGECKVVYPVDHFYKHKRDGYGHYCIPCARARAKRNSLKNPGYAKYMRATCQRWRENNRGWVRFARLFHTYKLTLDQYYSLEESQDFCCAICGEEAVLHVDHNHKTEKVRGLLCRPCNLGLGSYKDSPPILKAAVAYLEQRGHYGSSEMGGA